MVTHWSGWMMCIQKLYDLHGLSSKIIDNKLTDIHVTVEQYTALEEFALLGMG